jgi:ribonucleotide monophosphatase NagD (HAD superfamily)
LSSSLSFSGAFVHAFKSLFEHYSDIPLHVEFCGKPYPIQYTYAEELFRKNALARGVAPPTQCFGIGDNPKSDIRGANSAGSHWRSILVRTGVFQSGADNDLEDPADFVVQDVLEAVQLLVSELVPAES